MFTVSSTWKENDWIHKICEKALSFYFIVLWSATFVPISKLDWLDPFSLSFSWSYDICVYFSCLSCSSLILFRTRSYVFFLVVVVNVNHITYLISLCILFQPLVFFWSSRSVSIFASLQASVSPPPSRLLFSYNKNANTLDIFLIFFLRNLLKSTRGFFMS